MKKYHELEAEVADLQARLRKEQDKVTAVTNEKIDIFNKWVRGTTFKSWQREQTKKQETEKKLKAHREIYQQALDSRKKTLWVWPGDFLHRCL